MTITELYNQLCDKDFQNHQTGNLFFPAYMYMYNPEQEDAVEKEILDIHIEVALKKFRTGNSLNAYDVQMRLDEIASKDEFVAKWSNQTLDKLNVQYRKAIKDVGIYDGLNLIIPHRISSTFWQYFEDIDESWFLTACFLKN